MKPSLDALSPEAAAYLRDLRALSPDELRAKRSADEAIEKRRRDAKRKRSARAIANG